MIYKEKDDGNHRKYKGQLNPDAPGNGLFAFALRVINGGGNKQYGGDDDEDDADDGTGKHFRSPRIS